MKKILTYISVVALATGCAEMYGPEQVSTPVVKSDGIEISIATDKYDTDNTIVFTLAPKGEALYYSYAIEASATDSKPDSSVIYSGKYAPAVASAVIKWSEEKPSSTITVSDLAPNTQYQIYAVAGSPTRVPSSVAVKSFKTTDDDAPEVESDYDANVLTISFSEAVTRNTDLPLTVKYYGMNTTNIDSGTPEGEFQIPEDCIKVSASGSSSWIITIPVAAEEDEDTPPVEGSAAEGQVLPEGAYYSVDLPEGAFKDNAGNLTAAMTSMVKYDNDNGILTNGITGQNDASTYKFAELEAATFNDWKQPIVVASSGKYSLSTDYPFSRTAAATVVYKTGSKSITYTLTARTHFKVVDGQNIAFYLPEAPELGADVTITLAAGSVQDIYGNVNDAWTATLKYSYGYTLDDIVGTYDSQFIIVTDPNPALESGEMVIDKSNNEDKGNVVLKSMLGIECEQPVYATFNVDAGTLSIRSLQSLAKTKEGYNVMICACYLEGTSIGINPASPLVFSMTESGVIDPEYLCLLIVNGDEVTTGDEIVGVSYYLMQASKNSAPDQKVSLKSVKNLKTIPIR